MYESINTRPNQYYRSLNCEESVFTRDPSSFLSEKIKFNTVCTGNIV